MAYAIYQVDKTQWGTETRVYKTLDFKDQAVSYFNRMFKSASKADNSNETQPTWNFDNVWHLYVYGKMKRSFVLVRTTKKCDGKAEAQMIAEYTWAE